MTFQELKEYLLSKPMSTLDFPFTEDVPVFKVNKKMFALIGEQDDLMMLNLKCDPAESEMLRDIFSSIKPGYHMDKRHWISIYFDGSVPTNEIKRLIDNSFNLVVSKMSKKDQQAILVHL